MSIEQDLKSLLKTTVHVPVKDVAPHHIKTEGEKMSEIIRALEKDDLVHQTVTYNSVVSLEAANLADQLHHRASMMRIRADEFDDLADSISKSSDILTNHTNSFEDTYKEALDLLARHSHINPTKVEAEIKTTIKY